jgi:Fe2+ transport system protein FeoA
MLLSELGKGDHATVQTLHGTDDVTMRLLEMGVTPGVIVTLVGYAPLGDPLEISVRGYQLSLRRSEAQRIEVAPFTPGANASGSPTS